MARTSFSPAVRWMSAAARAAPAANPLRRWIRGSSTMPNGGPSRIFILRPVATSLLMIGLLLVGIVAYRQLPVSALPQADFPTIQVTPFYPPAGPHGIPASVPSPIH